MRHATCDMRHAACGVRRAACGRTDALLRRITSRGLRNGTLTRVLPAYRLLHTNLYVLYPSRRFVDASTPTWLPLLRALILERVTHIPERITRDMRLLDAYDAEQRDPPANRAADFIPARTALALAA
ncbi:hypothetical protein KPG66_14105 [Mycetohabitans sp. B2]|uniref:hypothetical protein n=1 Tax=Mycetohabitans sp. B2 TaxID=2841274 RepID=UPI001F1DD3E4|nr:hypothetical protein [Mycetohabitans sp. B2]MCF7697150.1 hypothetical protein [Mycetohabitans sp. B2]